MATDFGKICGLFIAGFGVYLFQYAKHIPIKMPLLAVALGTAIFLFSNYMSHWEERGERVFVLLAGIIVLPALAISFLALAGGPTCEWFLSGLCWPQ